MIIKMSTPANTISAHHMIKNLNALLDSSSFDEFRAYYLNEGMLSTRERFINEESSKLKKYRHNPTQYRDMLSDTLNVCSEDIKQELLNCIIENQNNKLLEAVF